MGLARHLIIWATCSLITISVIYAPRERLEWANETNEWVRKDLLNGEPPREFIWLIPKQGSGGLSVADWKYIPDWSRMAGEILLTTLIGGGLAYVLRRHEQKRHPG